MVQAFFAGGRVPSRFLGAASARAPHPAQMAPIAQMRAASRPPHPATVGRPSGPEGRPHPAKVGHAAQPFAGQPARPPHPAQLPQRRPATEARSAAQAAPDAQPSAGARAFQTPPGFLGGASAQRGQALPAPVQKKMEAFFGADFSDVRVHVGPEAASIGALAFTVGSDLYFAPGYYDPHSQRGQELLGHELTHVKQQREGRVANPFGDGVAVVQDPELEAEADRMGKAVAASAQPKTAAAFQTRVPAAPPRFPAAQAKSGAYELIVGTYLHEGGDHGRLPDELAGHSFVAIREPGGEAQAFGFSPANFGQYEPQRDLGRLKSGVEGVVHDDARAFDKPGVKTRSYRVTPAEAQAAMAKVAEYQSGKYPFSLDRRQCSTFALDVLRAAKISDLPGAPVRRPREMYRQIG
ncbi:DUF4157 domain-containing protein [Sorangium sp. So ce136]|uniref:eCIS core domain-containing protein n=1 Tax=Sorangium sp. So ce136 TaxID=3133284 RepID=UPI003F0474A5